MHTILITGANRGIGLEMAKQYSADGWKVIACCRDPAKADELQQLKHVLEILPLDVANTQSIHHLIQRMAKEPIDILMNNAGVWGPKKQDFGDTDAEAMVEVFKVNTLAPLLLAEGLVKNIMAGDLKMIVNIGSMMGSMALNSSGGDYAYRSSKAALNAITKSMAIDLKPQGITVIVLHPGWVQSNIGGPNASLTPKESVLTIRKYLSTLKKGDSGNLINLEGNHLAW